MQQNEKTSNRENGTTNSFSTEHVNHILNTNNDLVALAQILGHENLNIVSMKFSIFIKIMLFGILFLVYKNHNEIRNRS